MVLTPPISRLSASQGGSVPSLTAPGSPRPPTTRTVSHRPPPLAHVALRRNHAPQFQALSPTCCSPAEDEEFAIGRGCRSPASGGRGPGSGSVHSFPSDSQTHGSLHHPTTPTTPVPQSFGGMSTVAAAQHPAEGAAKKSEPFASQEITPAVCPQHSDDGERTQRSCEDSISASRDRMAQGTATQLDCPHHAAEPQSPVPSSACSPMSSDAPAENATAAPEQQPASYHQDLHDRVQRSHPANDAHAGEGAAFLAQIFSFQKWKPMKQESVPKLCETQPLSLYFHADEQLMSAVKALSKVREGDSDKFHRCTERVHRAQKLLLDTIYLIYSELDNDLKCPRDYRRHLPSEDQEELDDGFSENILFAAEALSRGFRIRGIERFTEQLLDPAKQLCAGFEALRFVFRSRALDLHRTGSAAGPPLAVQPSPAGTQSAPQSPMPSRGMRFARRSATVPTVTYGALHLRHGIDGPTLRANGVGVTRRWHGPFASLYPVLMDFDKAWVVFEQKICFAYFAVTYNRHSDASIPETIPDTFPSIFPPPDNGTEMFAVLISEALSRGVKGNLISWSRVQEFHPSVMFAIPRLAVVAGLVHMPDCVNLTDDDCAFWWFRDKAAILQELQRDLRSLSRRELQALEMALAGCGNVEEDLEDADLQHAVSTAAGMNPAAAPQADDAAAATAQSPSQSQRRLSDPSVGGAPGIGEADKGRAARGSNSPTGEPEVSPTRRDHRRLDLRTPDAAKSTNVESAAADPDETTSVTGGLPTQDLRRLFTVICNIADGLQSGPRAHEFSGVLEKAFRFHSL